MYIDNVCIPDEIYLVYSNIFKFVCVFACVVCFINEELKILNGDLSENGRTVFDSLDTMRLL